MTPERIDHMTVQYVWALMNNYQFTVRAAHEAKSGNFAPFRRLVGTYIMPIRKMLDEDHAHALSGTEWSFLYLETWQRLGGKADNFAHSNGHSEFRYQLERLEQAGFTFNANLGVVKMSPTLKNPCVEIPLDKIQPCTLNPEGETGMNDNYTKTPSCYATTLAPAFETKSYIFGNDVKNMTEEALISAIKRVEEQIADLKTVKSKSSKIASKIAELQEQLGFIVTELDAR